jgi:hypothetical protein
MQLVSRKQIAESYRISHPTVMNWHARGGITPVSSKPFLYRLEDVERYAEQVLPRARTNQEVQMKVLRSKVSGRYTISVGGLARLLKVPSSLLHMWNKEGHILWANHGVAFDLEDVLLAAQRRTIELRPDAVARLGAAVQLRRELS